MNNAGRRTAKRTENALGLPLFTLGIELLPILLFFLSTNSRKLLPFLLILIIFLPAVGWVMGIQALAMMEKRGRIMVKALALVTVILPPAFAVYGMIYFMKAVSGILLYM